MAIGAASLVLLSSSVCCTQGRSAERKPKAAPRTALPAAGRQPHSRPDRSPGATPDMKVRGDLVVRVLCRKAWGARPAQGRFVRHTIKRLTVHHSGVEFARNWRGPARIRSAQRFHQTGKRRWPDIAYHFLMDLRGNIYEGRPVWARGDTGTRYDTTSHFLVCLLGNYDEQQPTRQQLVALERLLAWASQRYGVSPATISSHRDYARTSCPGVHLHRLIKGGALQRRVFRVRANNNLRLERICGDAAARQVRQIKRARARSME